MIEMIKLYFYFCCCIYIMVQSYEESKFKKPHIILIVADDVGWNDVSFHGADEIPTPNIDALAYNGVILNKHYVLPTCTPSRTSLMTGRYAVREGLLDPIRPGQRRGIPLGTTLMPKYLRDLGYDTQLLGKWHLGYFARNHTPTYRGFNNFFGYYNALIGYRDFSTFQFGRNGNKQKVYDLHEDDGEDLSKSPADLKSGKYFTDLITEKAENIIKNNNNSKPLFLEIAHLAAHASDRQGNDRMETRDTAITNKFKFSNPLRRNFAGVMTALDESVGRIVVALKNANMLNNSIIVFISDNGAPLSEKSYSNGGSNYPLRGGKHLLSEGGVRGVACIYSPLIKSASRVSNGLMHISDWLPTLYAAAGGDINKLEQPIDGFNQWPSIVAGTDSPRKNVLIQASKKGSAAIAGDYKLIIGVETMGQSNGDKGKTFFYTSGPSQAFSSPAGVAIKDLGCNKLTVKIAKNIRQNYSEISCPEEESYMQCNGICLFDLKRDPCERKNIAYQYPQEVENLKSIINNPDFQIEGASGNTDPCSNPGKFFNQMLTPWVKVEAWSDKKLHFQCDHP